MRKLKNKHLYYVKVNIETFIEMVDDIRLENLEWVNKSENSIHNYHILGYKNNFHKKSREVYQYDLFGNFIKHWNCIREIERQLKIDDGNIIKCCKGKYKTVGGFVWKYKTY